MTLAEADSYGYREYLDNTMDDEPMPYWEWLDVNNELQQLNIDYDIEIDQVEQSGIALSPEIKERQADLLKQIARLEALLAY